MITRPCSVYMQRHFVYFALASCDAELECRLLVDDRCSPHVANRAARRARRVRVPVVLSVGGLFGGRESLPVAVLAHVAALALVTARLANAWLWRRPSRPSW